MKRSRGAKSIKLTESAAAALEFLLKIANVEAHSGSSRSKTCLYFVRQTFLRSRGNPCGGSTLGYGGALVWCQSSKISLLSEFQVIISPRLASTAVCDLGNIGKSLWGKYGDQD